MTPNDPTAESLEQETPRRPFRMPAYRTFVVRKYDATMATLVETIVKAHLVQPSDTGRVDFIDFEINPDLGPTTRLHRTFYNVEEVEDIDRPMPPSAYLVTH